jgi:hypothetical protein
MSPASDAHPESINNPTTKTPAAIFIIATLARVFVGGSLCSLATVGIRLVLQLTVVVADRCRPELT